MPTKIERLLVLVPHTDANFVIDVYTGLSRVKRQIIEVIRISDFSIRTGTFNYCGFYAKDYRNHKIVAYLSKKLPDSQKFGEMLRTLGIKCVWYDCTTANNLVSEIEQHLNQLFELQRV